MTLLRPLHRLFAPQPLALAALAFAACATDASVAPTTGVVIDDENVLAELESETLAAPETSSVDALLEAGTITEPPDVGATDETGAAPIVIVTPADREPEGLPDVGDVLVDGPSDAHPYGYARFIEEVRALGGGRFELLTRQATLAEIFEQLDFVMDVEPNRDAWRVSTVSDIGRSAAELSAGGTIELAPMFGDTISCGAGSTSLAITPTLSITPDIETEIEVRRRRLQNALFTFGGEIRAGIALDLANDVGLNCEYEADLGPAIEFTSTLPGTPPVVITHRIQPKVKVSVSATVGVSGRFEAEGSVGFRAGVEKPSRREPWRFIAEGNRDGSFTPPDGADGSWDVSVTVEPSFSYALFVYDTFGPDISVKLPLTGSVSGDVDGCITADLTAGLAGSVGVEVQIPVLDITVASASATVTLVEETSFPSFPRQYGTCAPDPCADAGTTCGECNDVEGCGWCNGVCQSDSEAAACGDDWRTSKSACEPCEATSCGECATSGFCGWCPGAGCVNLSVPSELAMCGEDIAINPGDCGAR